MSETTLSPEADRILEAVITLYNERGYAPTLQEIATATGHSSRSTALYHVRRLIALGKLEGEPGRSLRPAS